MSIRLLNARTFAVEKKSQGVFIEKFCNKRCAILFISRD